MGHMGKNLLGIVLDHCGPTVAWLIAFIITSLAQMWHTFFVLAALSHVAIEFKITKHFKREDRIILTMLFGITFVAAILKNILL